MIEHINTLSILVSAILAVAVGSIWYSPLLFGPAWMRSIGRSLETDALSQKEMISGAVKGVCTHIIFFYVVAQFVSIGLGGVLSLSRIGVLVTGLILLSLIVNAIWERRSLTYVLINAGYLAIVVFGGIGIIAYWPW